ncbi:MAG: hypothetical protein HDQ89_01135 [Desulfovibrio sp.]|nr:hypothetical protein [Desulfovibrio sp.]
MSPATFAPLSAAEDCKRLNGRFRGQKVVALWATTRPRQNVDVLLALKEGLEKAGIPVLFLLRENAAPLVAELARGSGDFFLLDDRDLFRFLPCIDLLVTHDYVTGYRKIPGFGGKVMYLNHTSAGHQGVAMDYFADYLVEINTKFSCDFDYTAVPAFLSVQHNSQLALVPAGSIKLDLLASARERAKDKAAAQGLLVSFYPLSSEHMLGANAAKISRAIGEWNAFVEGFFRRHPDGTFVFSPAIPDRKRDFIRDFAETWRHDGRFIYSEEDDNKYWLARSDFLITDWSSIDASWIFSTLRPAIHLRPGEGEPLHETAYGYTAATAEDALLALDDAQKNLWRWKARLLKFRHEQFPFFGRSVAMLCEAIRHIISADFPEPLPGWGVLDKNVTAEKPALALLRFLAFRKKNMAARRMLNPGHIWLNPAYIWEKVFQEIPTSGCLTLAALDDLLTYHTLMPPNELSHRRFRINLERALERVPQHIVYRFLVNRLDAPTPDLIRLLCSVVSHKDSTPAQKAHLVAALKKTGMDFGKYADCFALPPDAPAVFSPEVPGEILQACSAPRPEGIGADPL